MSSTLTAPVQPAPTRAVSRRVSSLLTLPEMRWAALALGLFALGGLLQLVGAPAWTWWTSYLACYVAGGWEPGLAGLRALREKTLDVDLLMVVAAIAAAAIGQVLEGALLIVIFATSGALEALATRRTQDSVTALLDLAPDEATRVDPDGTTRVVLARDLAVGDVVLVRPGERIAADGVVVQGSSDVDQSSITGESMPVVKAAGADVFAGTMNGTGALRVRASVPAAETVVARIVTMVEEASATKARTQLFVEKIEQRYSVGMVSVTVALLVVPLLLGAEFQPTLLRAITFMIVASPCAVVLATMPPLLSAIANAGRYGVLVKSAVVMEQLGLTDTVALDKTGTLTQGHPEVVEVVPVAPAGARGSSGSTSYDDTGASRALALAAAAETSSQHPLGAAVVRAAGARGIELAPATDFRSVPGQGVRATVNGVVVEVLSPSASPALDTVAAQTISAIEGQGGTAVVVVLDGEPSAVLGLHDAVRPDAAQAVADLAALTTHPPLLLTGDNAAAAARLAEGVGIAEVSAGLLPDEKADRIAALQSRGQRVLLVGDGVNDAPAMAAAHLGVAMGRRGSDLALQTADAVVIRDELSAIPKVVDLSRRARGVVVANLVLAGCVIVALSVWDLAGTLPLPLGVAGHEGSTVVVGLNGLRLLRAQAWERAGRPRA